MNDALLYGYIPCLVVLVAAGTLAYRYREPLTNRVRGWLDRHGWSSGAVALLSGGAVIALVHGVGFFLPEQVRLLIGSPVRMFAAEVVGLIGGFLLAYGLLWYALRRLSSLRAGGAAGWAWLTVHGLLLTEVLSGLHVAASLRWGSAWYSYVVVPYLRSVLAFQPDAELMAQLPFSVKLHLMAGVALLVAVPVARWLEATQPVPLAVTSEETAGQAGAAS